MNLVAVISVIGPVSPAGEMAVSPETAAVARPGILFERLTAVRCKCMITNALLFEWKTST